MKRIVLLLLLAALLISALGCDAAPTAAICLAQANGVHAEAAHQLQVLMVSSGYQVTVYDAGLDQARQDQQIQALLGSCDVLIVEPVMQESLPVLSDAAADSRVALILWGNPPEAETDLLYVGSLQEAAGPLYPMALQALPDSGDLNGDGSLSYAIITGPEDHVDALFCTEICREAVAGNCLDIYYGPWSQQSGRERCSRLLANYGKDLEVIFCLEDSLVQGAVSAIAEGGRTVGEDIHLIALGSRTPTKLLLRSGDLSVLITPDVTALAEITFQVIQDLEAGKDLNPVYHSGYRMLTKETVEEYL